MTPSAASTSATAVRNPVHLAPVPYKLVGVNAALKAASDPSFEVKPEIFSEFSLKGKTAAVTGGDGGLGLEFCIVLAELGAAVYAIDLPTSVSSDFEAAVAYCKKLGTSLKYKSADVTDPEQVNAVFEEIASENEGKVDVLIAAAGILGSENDVEKYPPELFRKVMDVNCSGVFYSAQAASSIMKRAGVAGSIILIASMSGSVVNREMKWAAYNISKSAVIQMARSMACELGQFGIRVNSLSPGHIRTKMTAAVLDVEPETEAFWASLNPLGRIGAVHELRGVAAWLASDASSFCTGSDILVSGGHTVW
ncbi:hypothetical protein BZA70DRAFT_95579 [Myxozyma melibiosi]|uniref:NAD(P)-binding protein n=1 Tax=Myxozyma melibiosi TaxID=54550 RepID=A0ABR1EZ82_9ASCO